MRAGYLPLGGYLTDKGPVPLRRKCEQVICRSEYFEYRQGTSTLAAQMRAGYFTAGYRMQKIVLNMCGPQHHIGEVVWEVVWEMFWGKAFKTFMFLSKSIECMSFFLEVVLEVVWEVVLLKTVCFFVVWAYIQCQSILTIFTILYIRVGLAFLLTASAEALRECTHAYFADVHTMHH
jgi:hypothetical protein